MSDWWNGLTLWKGVLLAILEMYEVISAVEVFDSRIAEGTVAAGYQNFLVCIEMFLAAILLRFAFPHSTYLKEAREYEFPLHAFHFDSLIEEIRSKYILTFLMILWRRHYGRCEGSPYRIGGEAGGVCCGSGGRTLQSISSNLKETMNPRDIVVDALHNFHPNYQQYVQHSSSSAVAPSSVGRRDASSGMQGSLDCRGSGFESDRCAKDGGNYGGVRFGVRSLPSGGFARFDLERAFKFQRHEIVNLRFILTRFLVTILFFKRYHNNHKWPPRIVILSVHLGRLPVDPFTCRVCFRIGTTRKTCYSPKKSLDALENVGRATTFTFLLRIRFPSLNANIFNELIYTHRHVISEFHVCYIKSSLR